MVSLCGATLYVFYQIGCQEYQKSMWSMVRSKPSVRSLIELGLQKMSQEIAKMSWEDVAKFVKALQDFMEEEVDEAKSN